MSVLHIASQSAGILSASPHISCGFKHRVSQEIKERNCHVMTALEPQVSVDSKDIKMHGTAREGADISLK